MPPAKTRPAAIQDDARSEGSIARDRSVNASSTSRKTKGAAASAASALNTTAGALRDNGSGLKEIALIHTESGEVVTPGQSSGIQWTSLPADTLDNYRVAHSIASPPAFLSNYNHAVLSHSHIGQQSPTMARPKDKRRVSKEHLATAVRKHFNGAAVSELDVIVELAYRAKTKEKAFRLRSGPFNVKR